MDPKSSLTGRLPRALALTVVVALVGGGAIGFATAAGDASTSFTVPVPMGGDKAVYDVTGPGAGWDGQQAAIEVRAPEPLMLEDGRWVSTSLMRAGDEAVSASFSFGTTAAEFSLFGWQAAYVDLATDDVVARGYAGGGSSSASSGGNLIGGESSTSQAVDMTVEFDSGSMPCGVQSGLQGGAVQVGQKVRVAGCGSQGLFEVQGLQSLGTGEALWLTAPAGDMQLWYQAGVPYPVRLDFKDGTDDEQTWTMTGFTRGTQPLVVGPVPPRTTPSPILEGATDRYGPALDGFDTEFTIPQAVQRAIDESQPVADFAAAHPDWFVRAGSYEERDEDGAVTGSWFLRMRGDADEIWFDVPSPSGEATSPVPSPVILALDAAQRAAGMESGGVHVWSDSFPPEEPAWPAECRNLSLPTIGSLAQRWSQMEQRPVAEANAYGFDTYCFNTDDEANPYFQVLVGDARTIVASAPQSGPLEDQQSSNTTQVLRMVAVDEDGELTLETTETATSRSSWGALQSPAEQGEGQAIETEDATVWATPSGPVAASITIVSVLVGLAYWLWPTLKLGPMALFSRLRTPDLLQHPVRLELVQRIEAQPGVHYQDLVRAVGKGKGAVEHHLRKLQEGGLVKSLATGGYTCYFPVAFDRRLAAATPALKSEGARALMAAIQATPGASAGHLAIATGLSPAAVSHHLQRLGAAGLVDVTRNGRSVAVQATALANEVAAAGAA